MATWRDLCTRDRLDLWEEKSTGEINPFSSLIHSSCKKAWSYQQSLLTQRAISDGDIFLVVINCNLPGPRTLFPRQIHMYVLWSKIYSDEKAQTWNHRRTRPAEMPLKCMCTLDDIIRCIQNCVKHFTAQDLQFHWNVLDRPKHGESTHLIKKEFSLVLMVRYCAILEWFTIKRWINFTKPLKVEIINFFVSPLL